MSQRRTQTHQTRPQTRPQTRRGDAPNSDIPTHPRARVRPPEQPPSTPAAQTTPPGLRVFTLAGDELRELRQRVGLSQAEFGRRIGYSPQAIYNWERGRRIIPLTQVERILEILMTARRDQERWRQMMTALRSSEGALDGLTNLDRLNASV